MNIAEPLATSAVVNKKNYIAIKLAQDLQRVRQQTLRLATSLNAEDMVVQSMPDASPTKWHLAHTSWFFEAFILQHYQQDFSWYNPAFNHLFNSYYESIGPRHARPYRGMLTRPALSDVLQYRAHIDDAMLKLIGELSTDNDVIRTDTIIALATIGLHHEMQHQELISTDILHLLWHNPLRPEIYSATINTKANAYIPLTMQSFAGGIFKVGQSQSKHSFSYDCEGPEHEVLLQPYQLSNRLINNAEWLEFMDDGGYNNSLLWLSDGWACVKKNDWQAPLYWLQENEQWFQYGLDGLQPVNLNTPVCHISYYEADAFARWAGKRLPTEHEWELAARQNSIAGNFLENKFYRPQAPDNTETMTQLYGDVWQWTASPFSPYPGFKAEPGALGEYNGKFMNNQYVLRGGSCVTPKQQLRATYRNFFYPHHRWQFTGLRLAHSL